MACPLRKEEGHEEHEDDQDAEAKAIGPTPWGPPEELGVPARATVRVREPARARGRGRATQSVALPIPAAAASVPPPGVEGGPITPPPSPAVELITDMARVIPQRWIPTAEDFAFLQREIGFRIPFGAAKGIPLSEPIRRMIAEESSARAFESADDTFSFPWWILTLPLFKEAYTRLKQSPITRGAGHPADRQQPRGPGGHGGPPRVSRVDRDVAAAAKKGAAMRPTRPVGGPAGGGKHINANTLLQGMVTKARRKVAPFRQSDPNL